MLDWGIAIIMSYDMKTMSFFFLSVVFRGNITDDNAVQRKLYLAAENGTNRSLISDPTLILALLLFSGENCEQLAYERFGKPYDVRHSYHSFQISGANFNIRL